ncbi:MAG: DNA-binding transcriptional LysR family regulator [Phenylobacterium sp.]
MQPRAAQMIALADNTRQQLCGQHQDIHCRVAAPAILQYRWASVISRVLSEQVAQSDSTLTFETAFEQAALNKLKQGEVHLALVTDAMLGQLTPELDYIDLGELQMQVAVGWTHPLASGGFGDGIQMGVEVSVQVSAEELLLHPFAMPHVSPFCGEERGLGCDGWQDQLLPRKTGWVVNDYAVLSQLVKSGQAVAYLPDFLLREWGLVKVGVVGDERRCVERGVMVFLRDGVDWVRRLSKEI